MFAPAGHLAHRDSSNLDGASRVRRSRSGKFLSRGADPDRIGAFANHAATPDVYLRSGNAMQPHILMTEQPRSATTSLDINALLEFSRLLNQIDEPASIFNNVCCR